MLFEDFVGALGLVVECHVCADVLHELDLLWRTCGGDDLQAVELGELDDHPVFTLQSVTDHFPVVISTNLRANGTCSCCHKYCFALKANKLDHALEELFRRKNSYFLRLRVCLPAIVPSFT